MEVFRIQNLTFAYPDGSFALENVTMSIARGELLLLLGSSGCGKTTLLRHLKPELTPHGKKEGVIYYKGNNLEAVPKEHTVRQIGYVFQNPIHQIVTDKVWHELAFGLENMQMPQSDMELRIGEVASYLGISGWFHKNVDELSGGQQQLLNLAAILAMEPEVIILDEPTSQLDPIAAGNFMEMVFRIKEEMGITIIITEHRRDEVYKMADRVAVMEKGKLLYCGGAKDAVGFLGKNHSFLMPVVSEICWNLKNSKNKKSDYKPKNLPLDIPVSLMEGRRYLEEEQCAKIRKNNKKEETIQEKGRRKTDFDKSETVLEAKELYYRYERKSPDILNHLSLKVKQGDCFGILGGNAAGKTTLLKLFAGMQKPYAGKMKISKKTAYLSQNPQNMFTSDVVEKEIHEQVRKWIPLFQMEHLLKKHPYDLSGGEQQRLALLKILGKNPSLLLLDEPTKGLDEQAKNILGEIFKELLEQGKTIIMVTHDIEFAARYTNRCGLLFDGRINGIKETRQFFLSNRYYTTIARRMTKGILGDIVLAEEVVI